MKILLLLPFLLIITVIPSYAEIDLSGQRILSLDGNMIIEFAENTYETRLHRVTITPNIGFGILQLVDGTVFLDSNNKVNVLGNSFSISLDSGKIYAHNMGDGIFSIVTLTVQDGKFQKQLFPSIIELMDFSIADVVSTEPIPVIVRENIELLMTGKYSMVTALKDQINFDIRVYDKALNPAKSYNYNVGYLEGADITIVIKDSQNKVIWYIEEKTNEFGYGEIEFRVESNFRLMGEHSVSITIQYDGNTYEAILPLFIEEQNADAKWMDFDRLL